MERYIESLPNGLDTVIDDAMSISVGQRQQINIARAIIRDSPILILDEATSAVDPFTERKIQNAMNEIMETHTSFVIAHRLSTIEDADMILVLKDGSIIEKGKHDELLAKGGFYRQLYDSQFESCE
jgi:ATP-binding cassette subfamily B protein